jgi:hypothetical protein
MVSQLHAAGQAGFGQIVQRAEDRRFVDAPVLQPLADLLMRAGLRGGSQQIEYRDPRRRRPQPAVAQPLPRVVDPSCLRRHCSSVSAIRIRCTR